MQTIPKAINFMIASLRANLYPVYDMGMHAVAAPNLPWMLLLLCSALYLVVIFR